MDTIRIVYKTQGGILAFCESRMMLPNRELLQDGILLFCQRAVVIFALVQGEACLGTLWWLRDQRLVKLCSIKSNVHI